MKKQLAKLALTAALGLAITFTLNACEEEEAVNIKDSRDGKVYKIVKIGEQVWMAENLNYEANGSKCYYNDPAYCEKYGRLYNWQAAMEACPAGWKLPDTTDWVKLIAAAGGTETGAKKLKSNSGWNEYCGREDDIPCRTQCGDEPCRDGNGMDDFGFSALPGGGNYTRGNDSDINMRDDGDEGVWWAATTVEDYKHTANYVGMYNDGDVVTNGGSHYKSDSYSVRCIKD